jgi:hypothetical protein
MKHFLIFLAFIINNSIISIASAPNQINQECQMMILKYESQKIQHPLLKNHYKEKDCHELRRILTKQHLENRKKQLAKIQKQREQERREEIYRKYLAIKIFNSMKYDLLPHRYF